MAIIRKERLPPGLLTEASAFAARELLPGEIRGAVARFAAVRRNSTVAVDALPSRVRSLVFIRGEGTARFRGEDRDIREIALLVLPPGQPATLCAGKETLEYLEILWDLNEKDREEIRAGNTGDPFFVSYSDCPTYREAIKSPRTVSRTLIDEHRVPRFCMGSVETTGPDAVAAHRHPMLEQFFFGLPGNDIVVTADDASVPFGEFELLHIPLGSNHGATVAEGKILHYLWIDCFMDRDGMRWISEQHIPETK